MYFSASNLVSILVAVIGAMGLIAAAGIGLLVSIRRQTKRSAEHSESSNYELKNDHKTNLRVDLDEKFEGLAVLVKGVRADVNKVQRQQHITSGQVQTLFRQGNEMSKELEATRPKPPTTQRKRATK